MKAVHYYLQTSVLTAVFLLSPAWAANAANPEIPNFHQVTDLIYRGGQPTDEGWKSLAKLGIKTVIDLRRPGEHSTELEEKAVKAAGMRYVNIPMEGIVAPPEEKITQALSLLRAGKPVFVHCRQGRDRTGTVIACYRIAHQGWQNQRALKEAKSHGMHWFEVGMKSYVMSFQAPVQRAEVKTALAPAAVVPGSAP